jgi:hypothetical protein
MIYHEVEMKSIFPIVCFAILSFCSCTSTEKNPEVPPAIDSTKISIDTVKAPSDAFLHNVPAGSKKVREEYSDITVDAKGNPEVVKNGTAYFAIYDKNGNLLEEGYYNADSSYYQKWIYEFDSHGMKTGCSELHKKGELAFKGFYNYDSQNHLVTENYFLPDGKLSYTISNSYDQQKNKTEINSRVTTPAAGSKANGKTVNSFNKNNLVITRQYFGSDGTLASIHNYKYDEKGNCIEDNYADPDNNTNTSTFYKYEFDEKGNWVKKTEFKKYDLVEKDLHSTVRSIEFY